MTIPVLDQPDIAEYESFVGARVPHHHFSPYSDNSLLSAALLRRPVLPVYGHNATTIITGKTIIITGAGGSIGSELAWQILHIDPKAHVYFIDHDEYAPYRLQVRLTAEPLLNSDEYILADILNLTKMQNLFLTIKPDIVFHAAAHKQLPLLERAPEAAIMTNIRGTHIVAAVSAYVGVSSLINISTDKAAHPTSVLGLTKRLAEMAAASLANSVTKVSSVRFGNVFGSRGSFVETLAYQVSHGLTVTITDPEMSRYFMTIPEAAGLVIEATAFTGSGKTYVLDMGKPIMITDLVARYIQLTNSELPNIRFTGIRSGEKLHEQLADSSEALQKTSHGRIFSVDVPTNWVSTIELQHIYDLATACAPAAQLKANLEDLVYSPTPARTARSSSSYVGTRVKASAARWRRSRPRLPAGLGSG